MAVRKNFAEYILTQNFSIMKQQTSATSETRTKVMETIDFKGKTIFVGIDVHQKNYQVAKICQGICLGNVSMNADADGLITHLKKHYPGAYFECVYECCAWGFNLQRRLTAAGMGCMVVHAADVSTSDKERKRKTDTVDALKLARNLASGDLKAIHVPEESRQKQRNLIRYRSRLVGDITRSKNRIKSLLKFQGIDVPEQFGSNKHWSRNFLKWIGQQASQDPLLGDTLGMMLEQLQMLRQLLLKTERQLRQLGKENYDSQIKLITSVPGIGPTTAMLFLLEIGDIKRFKGFDALNDFIGFCPDTNSSGDTDRVRGITKRRHRRLRTALVEAAWVAIRRDPVLMDNYRELTKRMTGNRAIIRIARKLLRRLRSIMISGIEYQKGVVKV